MALQIPMPELPLAGLNKAISTGGNLFQQMMQPVIEREKQKQLEAHFQEQLKLSKAAAARAGANSDLQRKKLEMEIRKLDPKFAMQQLKEKLDYINSLGSQNEMPGQSFLPGIPNQKTPNQPNIPSMAENGQESYINPLGNEFNNPEAGNIAAMIASNPQLLSQIEKFFPENEKGSYLSSIMGKFSPESEIANAPEFQRESYLPNAPQYEQPNLGSVPEINTQQMGGNKLPGGLDLEELKRALILQSLGIKYSPLGKTTGTNANFHGNVQQAIELEKLRQEKGENSPEYLKALELLGRNNAGKNAEYHGDIQQAIELEKLRKEKGDNSPEYLQAAELVGGKQQARKDLQDLRARTKAGLKPGETEFFDPVSKVPLGKNIPLTGKEREAEEGNFLFNYFYPVVYKGAAPFSGEGSIRKLEWAAENYKTNPKARKAFDDLYLAWKTMAATTVNEATTLKSGKQLATYNTLKESLEADDIPQLMKKYIKQFKIPAEASMKAAMRYQELISNGRKLAKKSVPATQKYYYDPELQAQHEQAQSQETPHVQGQYKDDDLVIVEGPNGEETMTYAKAKSLGAM